MFARAGEVRYYLMAEIDQVFPRQKAPLKVLRRDRRKSTNLLGLADLWRTRCGRLLLATGMLLLT